MVIGLVAPFLARVMSLDAQEEKSLDRLAEVCLPTAALQLNNVLQETAQSTGVARTNILPKDLRTQVRDNTASSQPVSSGHCLVFTLERDTPHRQGQETRPADRDQLETDSSAAAAQHVSAWQEEVKIARLPPDERVEVLRMLEPHHSMWDGRLGTVSATTHRIEVVPGSKPVHAQPYRAGANARAAKKT
jgi:hypothetical protein